MFLILLLGISLFAADSDVVSKDEIVIRGRVVDLEGKPVAKAKMGTIWSPNAWFDENGKRRSLEGKNAKETADLIALIWGTQGPILPTSQDHNQLATDEEGHFKCSIKRHDSLLLAIDEQQKNAGLIDFDTAQLPEEIVIRLSPAIEVTGSMIVQSTGKSADWSIVYVEPSNSPADPMASRRLMICGTFNGRFKFKLPPGNYELIANSDIPFFQSKPLTITLKGDKLQEDVGEILLLPTDPRREERIEIAKKDGRTIDVKELTGKHLPPMFITDARGLDPKGGVEQFRGRWTLVYFWSPSCRPCATKEVPRLTQFMASQNAASDKIAVVSFLLGSQSWKTIADADKVLEPIGKRYWGKEWEKLPQAFDSSDRTRESIAEELFGAWVLLDPNGIVEATGDDTSIGIDLLQKRSSE